MSWSDVKNIFFFAVVAVAGLVFVAVIFLTYAGKIYCFSPIAIGSLKTMTATRMKTSLANIS